jgi:bifunctional DNase/RNase
MIEMNIKGLMVDPITNMPIIILPRQRRAEGVADLGWRVRGQRHRAADREHQTPRPMTHDLLRNIIQDLQATSTRSSVCDLKENTFYALIHLQNARGPVAIDARPSDAIALALRHPRAILGRRKGDRSREDRRPVEREAGQRSLQQWLEQLDPDEWVSTRCEWGVGSGDREGRISLTNPTTPQSTTPMSAGRQSPVSP